MPLTPADVHNVAFKKPAIGKRGYDEEDVDAFLDEVEQELIRLLEENRALHDQTQRPGPGGPAASGPNSRALEAELSDLTAQLGRLQEARARAEQNARSMQTQLERARRETPAGPPPVAADGQDSPVLMMARRTADEHMRDARSEADTVISAAQAESDKVSSDAQLAAGTIESDARRKHTEAMNTLGDKRAELLNEIDKLGRLAQTYQQALGDHVSRQLQELDSTSGRELD